MGLFDTILNNAPRSLLNAPGASGYAGTGPNPNSTLGGQAWNPKQDKIVSQGAPGYYITASGRTVNASTKLYVNTTHGVSIPPKTLPSDNPRDARAGLYGSTPTTQGLTIPSSIGGTYNSTVPTQATPGVITHTRATPAGSSGGGGSTGAGGGGGAGVSTAPPAGGNGLTDTQLSNLISSAYQGITPQQLAAMSQQSNKDALAMVQPQVNALKIQQQGLESEARTRAQLIAQAGDASANLLSKQLPSYTYAGAGKDLAAIGNLYGNSLNANQQGAVNDTAQTVGAAGGSFNPVTTSGFNTATAPALGTSSTSFGSAALPAEMFAKNAAAQAQINHTMPLNLIGGARQTGLLTLGAGQEAAQKINPQIQNILASLPKYAQSDLKNLVSNANLTTSQRLAGLKLYLAEHDKEVADGFTSRKLDQGDVALTISDQTSTSLANRRAAQTLLDKYKALHPASTQINPLTLAEELAHGSGAHTISGGKNADGSSNPGKLVKSIPPAANLTQAALIYAQNTHTSLSQAMQTLAPYKTQWANEYTALLHNQQTAAQATKLFGAGAGTSGGTG